MKYLGRHSNIQTGSVSLPECFGLPGLSVSPSCGHCLYLVIKYLVSVCSICPVVEVLFLVFGCDSVV